MLCISNQSVSQPMSSQTALFVSSPSTLRSRSLFSDRNRPRLVKVMAADNNKDNLDHLRRQNKLQSPQSNQKRSAPIGLWDRFPTARTVQQMMDTMENVMEDPFAYGGGRWASPPPSAESGGYRRGRTPWEIKEAKSGYKMRFDMPGMRKEDVKIWVEEKMLVVEAEKLGQSKNNEEENGEEWSAKTFGKCSFRIALPENVEFEKIKAEVKDGVLYITIPKTEVEKSINKAQIFDSKSEALTDLLRKWSISSNSSWAAVRSRGNLRMATCAVKGGCPSDYVAVSISLLSIILLLVKAAAPYLIHKIPCPNNSSFWLVAIQVIASINLLLSLVVALGLLRLRRHGWSSCYIWAVWIEGPLGFGLLLSCRIVQVFQLYNIFVKRHLPPIRSFILVPLVLSPWLLGAALIHVKKPLNHHCHMGTQWFVPVICLHAFYVAALVGLTGAVRHVRFRFHELKVLWRGILVSTCSIGIWVVAYILNEIHEDILLIQTMSRCLLLVTTSALVLAFFSSSLSQPLVSLLSLRKNNCQEYSMMGQALGIHESGILVDRELMQLVDCNQPLDKLLLNRRFRQSFMEFANSCLAGEGVHFYEEVQLLDKIPVSDDVRRIYMARHIIDKYITPGSTMEVNISHRCRQAILSTPDLAHPNLFKTAVNELLQLMKMNLLNDYWSSTFFIKLKEEAMMKFVDHEQEQSGWNFSHRLSCVHCADDPFHQEPSPRKSVASSHDFEVMGT